MAAETTLVMIKPDGVDRGLCGEILSRFERTGLKIAGIRLFTLNREQATDHYAEHVGKHFFDVLLDYVTSGPMLVLALEGPNAVAVVRKLMGSTKPEDAATGTIRGDLALHVGRNLIHGSEHEFDAKKEVPRFFAEDELTHWNWDGAGEDEDAKAA